MIKIPIRAYQLTRKHSALVAEGKKYEDAAIEVGLTKKNIDKLSKCDVLSIEGISEESDNDVKDDRTNVEGSFINKTMRESVRKCLEKNLDARTYELMCYRYGLGGKPQCTLRRTGALLGLSPERVRQIQRSTEIKLKACTELRDLYA
jgi:DNA-directed RNA polymerase sigma subunit (sigma70/sigma32)